ncbi:unnamed protein product [Didymodactylos carnosus]|uniref:Uncharacterized protein n=1 Tax=Didymodactylos carnosus TaxID=1234261 RepID=A0A816FYP2_9BILA|nr:unnamed protein product [Didymodactylos carnosus]CAF1667885.1 unnamed protein product [Didymodactylos carnosus]CAF3731535.1 unnamed protein product [Didymodactylos carnosus]CAF4632573.1 unnamed protein product [Didymodactylos carnosus]
MMTYLNCGVLYFKTLDDVSSIKVGLLSISACNSNILIRGGCLVPTIIEYAGVGDEDEDERVCSVLIVAVFIPLFTMLGGIEEENA